MHARTVFTCICSMVCLGGLAAHAMAAQPIVYYSFDTLTNPVPDQSGHGNDGTVNGGVTLDAGGHLGNCFAFNGTNSYIQLSRVIQDSFTISAWIKTSTAGRAGNNAYEGSGMFWSDVAGAANDFVVAALGTKLSFFVGNPDTSVNSNGDIVTGEWVHIATVRDTAAKTLSIYIGGVLDRSASHGNTGSLTANPNFVIGSNTLDSRYYTGLMDEVRIFDVALSEAEIRSILKGVPVAEEPVPADKAVDVPRDMALGWTAGEFAAAHDVYLGTSFADVNSAGRTNALGVLAAEGQTATELIPAAPFEYGQTYYWRIDEVNAAPDNTIFKGDVWSFTAEPFAYPVAGVTATASNFQSGMTPQNTVNGSGLNADDQHGTEPTQMWMTNGGKPAWIQFEFARVEKLQEMWVWNSNQMIESFLGFGAKSVTVEYSTDGATWTTLADAPEFAKATGAATYTANTIVPFGGVAAKYVKLTINSNWGGMAPQTGLAEVRFFQIPVQARLPVPADEATGVTVDTRLDWRPGREATSHKVFFGVDEAAVAAGAAAASTVTEHGFAPAAMQLGTRYFWKVDEVGVAGAYEGDVWSFTTQEFIPVDDFEAYNDDDHRVYDSWIDGLADSSSGSTVGYMQAPFAEKTIVRGKQSMPLAYDNSKSPFFSEAVRTFDPPQDWTRYGITTLVVHVRGQVTNTPASMYVKINNTKISFNNNTATAIPLWKSWAIPLAGGGANLKSVKSLTIGVEGSGVGTVFIDDIRLYAAAPQSAAPVDPGTTGLVALYAMEGTVQDSSGKNYHGTLNGQAVYDTGYSGQALVLNGTNAYVDLPIGPLVASLTDATIATHVYFGGGNGAWQRIFDFGSGSGASPYMFLSPRQGTNGNMRFAIRTATVAEQIVNSPGPMTVGWHHTAIVIDGQAKTLTLYLDGEPVASAATAVLPTDLGKTTQNWIGRSQYETDAYLLGSIDDFRIYNRALSDAELRYLAGDR